MCVLSRAGLLDTSAELLRKRLVEPFKNNSLTTPSLLHSSSLTPPLQLQTCRQRQKRVERVSEESPKVPFPPKASGVAQDIWSIKANQIFSSRPRACSRNSRRAHDTTILPDEPRRKETRRSRFSWPDFSRKDSLHTYEAHSSHSRASNPSVQQGRARVLETSEQGRSPHPSPAQKLQLGQG